MATAGTRATSRQYGWRDLALPVGTGPRYYRLRLGDLLAPADRARQGGKPPLTLFPNPALTGEVPLLSAALGAAVDLHDELGREWLHSMATDAVQLRLPHGTYLVRVGAHPLCLSVS